MMIHTKSLIRRLDCVPWFLAVCFMLGWVGETHAQSGAALLQVAPGATIAADGAVTARTDTVMLELNTRHIYEYNFHKEEKPLVSVEIEVTATRLNKATGAKEKGQGLWFPDAHSLDRNDRLGCDGFS